MHPKLVYDQTNQRSQSVGNTYLQTITSFRDDEDCCSVKHFEITGLHSLDDALIVRNVEILFFYRYQVSPL